MPIEIQELEVVGDQPTPTASKQPAGQSTALVVEAMRRWRRDENIQCERMRVD
jgi:hypothetical protein